MLKIGKLSLKAVSSILQFCLRIILQRSLSKLPSKHSLIPQATLWQAPGNEVTASLKGTMRLHDTVNSKRLSRTHEPHLLLSESYLEAQVHSEMLNCH